jgi:hypothetical protein
MSTAPGVTTSPNVVEPGAENPRKRATHAIQRLREKRELERQIRSGAVLREAQATKKVWLIRDSGGPPTSTWTAGDVA